MQNYQNILLLTDLREDCDLVVERAKTMLSENGHLSLLHIVEETVLTAGYEIVPIVPIGDENELSTIAQEKMQELLKRHNLNPQNIEISSAISTRRGILKYAEQLKPDLIVIGRHKRTGLASLLGSTADDILPDVDADVLVVKLGEPV